MRSASLRDIRQAKGKTQIQLAVALSTNQADISRIERFGKVKLSTIRRYARALGARCDVLFVFPSGRKVEVVLPATHLRRRQGAAVGQVP